MIKKHTRRLPATGTQQRTITAGTSITAGVQNRQARKTPSAKVNASIQLSPEKEAFVRQLRSNMRRKAGVMAATNTSNIMARPDFLEMLPMFAQKLLILDVMGSVAMKSRQQMVPYFKFVAENTKGQTHAGDILSSPFVNKQGMDPNFTGRSVKGEVIGEGDYTAMFAAYTPILPGSVTVYKVENGVTTPLTDDGMGALLDSNNEEVGYINYSNGNVKLSAAPAAGAGNAVKMTYQYDNETIGPDAAGNYGAKMAKGSLQLDEFNLVAEAHEIACYWSIYAAFAAQSEYGSNIGDIAKEAAFAELTAEINSAGFGILREAATINPAFNWDAAPVHNGSVVPSDYLNMLKLKFGQASASVYQRTRLSRPNIITCGSNAKEYISMINGFKADNVEESVGPYKAGQLDEFSVYVDPNYAPDEWVMSCKSKDIRRNSALFGEYMPMINTDALGMANASVQQGYATMYAMKVVNPDTVVRGKILGGF